MKKTISYILIFLSLFLSTFDYILAYVNVKGYYKKNGTYVAPHVRSNPNGLKYDNYGWQASQGLYNDTYGTRGNNWDTPTYITDPDYYEGKALHDTNSTTSSYSSSLKISNLNCYYKGKYYKKPANAHCVNNGTDAWLCNDGFIEKGNLCLDNHIDNNEVYSSNKVDCGIGGTYYDSVNSCICSTGYKKQSDGKCSSNKVDCGIGGTYYDSVNSCICSTGYKKQSDGKCSSNKVDCGIGGTYYDSIGKCI